MVLRSRSDTLKLGLATFLAGSFVSSAAVEGKPIKAWRVELDRVKGCRLLPNETYTHSLHADLLFDRQAGLGMMVPVQAQERLTYQCGGQKAGVFLYEVGAAAADSALQFVEGRLWGGPGPTAEHPDRAYQIDGTVIVISSASRTPLDGIFGAATRSPAGPGGGDSQPGYQELSEKGNLLLYKLRRYDEALVHFRGYKQKVDADPGAPPLARWDAAMGLGFSGAFGDKLAEARIGFLAAVEPAKLLGPRKLADTQFNLACAEAELGHADAAIAALTECMAAARQAGADLVAHYRQSLRTDSSLRSLQNDPRLLKLVSAPTP